MCQASGVALSHSPHSLDFKKPMPLWWTNTICPSPNPQNQISAVCTLPGLRRSQSSMGPGLGQETAEGALGWPALRLLLSPEPAATQQWRP